MDSLKTTKKKQDISAFTEESAEITSNCYFNLQTYL